MAIAAGDEERPQESYLPTPTPEPAEAEGGFNLQQCNQRLQRTSFSQSGRCAGLQYARLDTGDAADQAQNSLQTGADSLEHSR